MRLSTLDAVGKGKFTVLTGLAGAHWAEGGERIALPFTRVVQIGTPDYQDIYCDWHEIMEVEEAGVILVRPDGYVAWRRDSYCSSPEEAESILRDAFQRLLSQASWGSAPLPAFVPNFGPRAFD
jgi:2,4-dichlorophenol 6-monooxygenase